MTEQGPTEPANEQCQGSRSSTLEVEYDGGVVSVWLNRPRAHNAIDDAVLADLEQLYRTLQRRFDTRVIILGGKGPSFSAGADRRNPPGRAPSNATSAEARWCAQRGLRTCQAIAAANAVTIARTHGHVIGGGVVLALACDLRIGADTTSFQIPEVGLGLGLAWGGVPRLINEIGAARARELVLMSRRFDAATAEQLGVLHRAAPHDQVDHTVAQWATELARKPELAVQITKQQFRAYDSQSVMGDFTEADAETHIMSTGSAQARAAFG